MTDPTPTPLVATVRVRTYELDSFAHVNNAEYLHYCEDARTQFFAQMGLAFSDLRAHAVQLVIVEARLRFLKSAGAGDTLTIRGRFREVRAASAWIDYRMTREGGGEIVCEAETKGAFLDAVTLRPCRAPALFREAFLRFGVDGL